MFKAEFEYPIVIVYFNFQFSLMTPSDPAIQVDGLTHRYGDIVAVNDLDLTVEQGEVYGFLGPNGAGKSTTINILIGTTQPTSGSVSVLGYEAQTASGSIRQAVGLLPGEFGLFERLTGREHVVFAQNCKDVTESPDDILARVGLADVADQRASGYSTGMGRRLALAMALTGDPDLLVLDEPTRGLDPNGARTVRSIVREEVERGATVFFSSHSMEQVESVCDRVGVLRDGQLVAEGDVEMLRTRLNDHQIALTVERVPDGLPDQLGGLDAVSDVQIDGTTLTISLTVASRKAAVIDATEAAGATVIDIETYTPSLEEFFAAVTDQDGEVAHNEMSAIAAATGGDA
ncbi:copper ABC transporter ATP-binding protein [Halorubrum californiense DSM 19288]|uniref:Copper ABC transporter ATP-binding protein n=2 Tax=Haloferacaceae TaxID=1644056 RepID=M0E2G5_9EURY|nr:copper ABC transporter ATP-binding protein [Halorubrum californiense DSM 19288]